MRLRPTTWLLTLLFGVAACFGTPAANIAIPRASYSVVWPGKSAGKPTVPKEEIAESHQAVPRAASDSLKVIAKDDYPAPAALLDPSLFQRPPPAIPPRP